jgi:beta-phosphoglucomutase-like phosphatase (HAD superfamily)
MPPRPENALLFDIDGTLADTDALHLEAFNLVLGPRGHVFDHGRFTRELQGFSNAKWLSWKRRKLPSVSSFLDKFNRCRA